jgi:limonene 1,2-monooxygenase
MSVPRETEARADINYLWAVAEEAAAEPGQTVRREEWRLVLPVHLVESRNEARNDLRLGAGRFNREYLAETLGRPLEFDGPVEHILDHLVETGEWIVGTPDVLY